MRDLFDDFMDELRKREAAARGEDPGPRRQRPPDPDDDDDDRARPDDADDESGDGGSGRPDDDADDATDERRRRRSTRDDHRCPSTAPATATPRPGRARMTAAGNRAARAGRRLGIALLILALLGIFLLFSVGIDLWTDVAVVRERRLRPGLLDAADRDRRAGHRGVPRRARRAARQPLAGRPAVAAAVGRGWHVPLPVRPAQRGGPGGRFPSRQHPLAVRWGP